MTETRIDPLAWCEDYSEVHSFGEWLVDQGQISDTHELLRYFEKPWCWAVERAEYEKAQDIPL
jgi:hypothetical protein